MTPMIEKPPHGAPCNGCGQCCQAEPCVLAMRVFGISDGPCPALFWHRDVYVCGLAVAPEAAARLLGLKASGDELRASAKVLIGAGMGCDAQLVDEPRDETFSARLEQYRTEKAEEIVTALDIWSLR